MPSSLAVIHSSTLGFSPHPPVSVYGTGRLALSETSIFLRAWLPALSARPQARGTVGFQLSPTTFNVLPSARGSVTSRSRPRLQGRQRNFDRFLIGIPLRVTLSSRLTLIRLTLFRKPWVFGVNFSIFIVVTYAYIFVSSRSRMTHVTPSRLTGMLPYRCIQCIP